MKTKPQKNIAAIARECGVSAMTVSRALRGDTKVKEETRRRVVDVAEQVGYIRAPRLGRPSNGDKKETLRFQLIAGTIGRNMAIFHSQLLTTIEQQLAKNGYECVVRTCNGDYQQFIRLLENVRSSDAEGTMIVGSFDAEKLAALLQASPEAILLDDPGISGVEPHHALVFDNVEAARIGVGHLLAQDRRRILLLSGTTGHFFSRDIEHGYRDALARHGLEVDEKLIVNSDFTSDSACAEVSRLLDEKQQFDAVFTNDEMASGVYRALLARNLRIPDDVAVCGCDGLPVGEHLFPRLTTVFLDYEELGRSAIDYLLKGYNLNRTILKIQLIPRLLIRESTINEK